MTDEERAAIVEAAREWVGTRYLHQASLKGHGADCLGLVRGIWREVLGPEPEGIPAYTPDWSEADRSEELWNRVGRVFRSKPVSDMRPGDILLFRMRHGSVAKHLGIQTEAGDSLRFIHSYSGHGVVESALSAPWARRVIARFEFPM